MDMINRVRNLRVVGIAEGVSFIVLLAIAMPMKYYMDIPEAVKVVGWAHGVLFMAYGLAVLFAIKAMRWSFFSVMLALAASLVPFGTFVLDKQLRRRAQELSDAGSS